MLDKRHYLALMMELNRLMYAVLLRRTTPELLSGTVSGRFSTLFDLRGLPIGLPIRRHPDEGSGLDRGERAVDLVHQR